MTTLAPSSSHLPSLAAISVDAEHLDLADAAARYREHGCLVIRGLMRDHVAPVLADIQAQVQEAEALLPKAAKVTEGWTTPDGTLWLPAPAGFQRDKQIMCLRASYRISAALLQSALEPRLCDLAAATLGPDVELFMEGQILYKEANGGHPKHLHQDASYFEHAGQGPFAALTYLVDTDLGNGALHVVPGSHRLGVLPHIDTFSHLGLDPQDWPWERALPIPGRAGDTICFHVNTIHGSRENHSAAPRPVFIHRYRAAGDYVVVDATTAENRATAEAARAEAHRKRHAQAGLMVRGRRRWDA